MPLSELSEARNRNHDRSFCWFFSCSFSASFFLAFLLIMRIKLTASSDRISQLQLRAINNHSCAIYYDKISFGHLFAASQLEQEPQDAVALQAPLLPCPNYSPSHSYLPILSCISGCICHGATLNCLHNFIALSFCWVLI